MNDEDQNQQKSYGAKKSAELRERRKAAGVVQVVFYIREQDKTDVANAVRDFTDRAWLALYENGAIERRDDPSRAASIRARLQFNSQSPEKSPDESSQASLDDEPPK